jgi:hypothetical protein
MKKALVSLLSSGIGAAVNLADKIAENADARIERKTKVRMMRIELRRARREMRRDTRRGKKTPSLENE